MSKITLPTVTNANNLSTLNSNFAKIEDALNSNVLYRDNPVGEPNQLLNDVDVNGQDLLNINSVHTQALLLKGVDIGESVQSSVATAAAQAVVATSQASSASTSASNAASSASQAASTLSSSLLKASNLNDLASASAARSNLGLGSAAVQNITYFAQVSNNLSDIPSVATARTNLGLGSIATQAASAVAITGGAVDNTSLGTTTPVQAITNTGLYTGQRFGASAAIVLRSANGTQAAPTQITAATTLSLLVSRGYNNASGYNDVASISVTSDGAVTSASSPGYMSLSTTPSGSIASTERVRITSTGKILLGASIPTDNGTDALQVNGSIGMASSTLAHTSVAFTNGSAAATGTLTNAPVAGNPTKWIPINDNGTTRYIPAW